MGAAPGSQACLGAGRLRLRSLQAGVTRGMPLPAAGRCAGIAVIGFAALAAEEGVFQFFDPRPTPSDQAWRFAAEGRATAAAEGADGAGALAVGRWSAQGQWLAWRQEAPSGDEWWLGVRAAHTVLAGDLHLPTGQAVAGDYLDLGTSLTWRRRSGGGGLVGASLAATAEGQAPADAGLDLNGQATVFGRIPLGEAGRDGLLLALNYDTDRVVFGNVPVLPLIAWQGVRGPWIMLLGVPFCVVTWRGESARVTAIAGPLPALSADLRLGGPLHLTGEARYTLLQLRRADRAQADDRVRLGQWEWSGGLALILGPRARIDLVGGAATARRISEVEDAADARHESLRLEAAPFVALRCRFAF